LRPRLGPDGTCTVSALIMHMARMTTYTHKRWTPVNTTHLHLRKRLPDVTACCSVPPVLLVHITPC